MSHTVTFYLGRVATPAERDRLCAIQGFIAFAESDWDAPPATFVGYSCATPFAPIWLKLQVANAMGETAPLFSGL